MQNIAETLKQFAGNGYYVGGCVRDGVTGRASYDIDIALPAESVKTTMLNLAKALGAAAFEMCGELGIWRIVTKQENLQIDITAYQGKTFEEDLKRRDFSVNALAYPINTAPEIKVITGKEKAQVIITFDHAKIIDLNNGLKDLQHKIIRANAPQVFEDDPLRILRAYRNSAELGFTISPETKQLMKQNYPLANLPAGERTREELIRIFNSPAAYAKLSEMDGDGLLTTLFPVLEEQRNCAVEYYGEGGVLKHTLEVVERMEYLLSNLKKVFPVYAENLKIFTKEKHLYIMAALLHDIAKPATAKEIDGRLRFFFHEEKGAKMAQEILENLRYSTQDSRLICAMIAEHLRPSNLAHNDIISERAVYRFFRALGDAGIPMLLLCWADYASYISHKTITKILPRISEPVMKIEDCNPADNADKTLRHMQVLSLMFDKYFNAPQKINPPKLIDGKDIMKILQIPPGPLVGEILNTVAEAQVEGKINTKQEAAEFIKHLNQTPKEKPDCDCE